jgi:TusA-related sulfurtransferase
MVSLEGTKMKELYKDISKIELIEIIVSLHQALKSINEIIKEQNQEIANLNQELIIKKKLLLTK